MRYNHNLQNLHINISEFCKLILWLSKYFSLDANILYYTILNLVPSGDEKRLPEKILLINTPEDTPENIPEKNSWEKIFPVWCMFIPGYLFSGYFFPRSVPSRRIGNDHSVAHLLQRSWNRCIREAAAVRAYVQCLPGKKTVDRGDPRSIICRAGLAIAPGRIVPESRTGGNAPRTEREW